MRKILIVNADDFGLSEGVNEGVVKAHRDGIVTRASLMVRQPAARSAAEMAARFGKLSVGLHLDIGEWRFENNEWVATYERASLTDAAALEAEVQAQIELFRELNHRDPAHLDAHQHAHRNEPLKSIVVEKGRQLGVPVRFHAGVRYLGEFYGQDDEGNPCPENVSPAFLIGLIERLEAGKTELCCHPAAFVDFEAVYSRDRIAELAALTDPRVREALGRSGVELAAF